MGIPIGDHAYVRRPLELKREEAFEKIDRHGTVELLAFLLLFLRNLQAAVESAERDALLVVGGDFNAQLGVRPPGLSRRRELRAGYCAWSVWDSARQQSRRGSVGCAGVL